MKSFVELIYSLLFMGVLMAVGFIGYAIFTDSNPLVDNSIKVTEGMCFQKIQPDLEIFEHPNTGVYGVLQKGIKYDLVVRHSDDTSSYFYCSAFPYPQELYVSARTKPVNCTPEARICINSYKGQGVGSWEVK